MEINIKLDENKEVVYSIKGECDTPTAVKVLTTVINAIVDDLEEYDTDISFKDLLDE